jgi:hypothetical protein
MITISTANDVVREAAKFGACSKSGSVTDWKSLCWLFFSPQGREFCEDNNFPSIEMFRDMKDNVRKFGVHVDSGLIFLENEANVGIIGNTEAHLTYTDNTKVYKVVLMHSGKAHIVLKGYSVVLIERTEGCEVIIDKDKTARVLWQR